MPRPMTKDESVPDDRTHAIAEAAIGLFLEYRDVHGYAEDAAQAAATRDSVEGERAREEVAAYEREEAARTAAGQDPDVLASTRTDETALAELGERVEFWLFTENIGVAPDGHRFAPPDPDYLARQLANLVADAA